MKANNNNIETFIRSAITQRQRLLNGGNRKNIELSRNYITWLTNHLNAYSYSPESLAQFFLRNYDKIVYLLPPNRHKTAIKLKTDCLIKTI